jgi:hypothetical protein
MPNLQPNAVTAFTAEERAVLRRLDTPERIQAFLDPIPYNDEITCRSPRRVLRDRRAHCFEGALLAAAALERLRFPPLLVDLGAVRDDDHVIALFGRPGALGALAKSNFTGLRYRAPVYRTLRELVMSYFDDYFNTAGERTLRTYSRPLLLRDELHPGWRTAGEDLDDLGDRLDRAPHYRLLTPRQERALAPVDGRLLESGMLGCNPNGLYRVEDSARQRTR